MKYLIPLLFLVGCSAPTEFATAPVENFHGQTTTFVSADVIHGWFLEHRNVRIVALSGWAISGGNATAGYIVIYETPKVQVEQ